MKRVIAAIVTGALFAAGTGITIAAASSGVPEVNEANATIQLASAKFVPTTCAGEDGIKYVTYRGTWKGGETDVTPGSTDYNLSGPLTISKVVWTINLSTQRGVLRGTASLVSAGTAGLTKTYVGPMVLITQGLPNAAGDTVQARGWINAATYSNSVADGGSLLANVEFAILPGFAANGSFGNSTMGFQDLSVATNNQAC
jgi:hypothetical protein